jgi:hypothetical protein
VSHPVVYLFAFVAFVAIICAGTYWAAHRARKAVDELHREDEEG